MRPHKPYNKRYLSIVFALLGFVISSYFLVMANIIGINWLFGISLLVCLAFVVYTFLAFHHFCLYIKPVFLSIVKSAWGGLKKDVYISGFVKKRKKLLNWIFSRFSLKKWDGVYLTTTISLFIVEAVYFLNLAFGVIFKDQSVAIDTRLANMVPVIRSDSVTSFAVYITNLGGWQTLLFGASLILLFLLKKKHNHLAVGLLVGIIAERIISIALKNLLERPRPQVSPIIEVSEFSFPSGHSFAATVIFGLLAYFIYKGQKKPKERSATIAVFAGIIALISLSRIYLGVHYLSDVLAGIALGLMVITPIIGFMEIDEKYFTKKRIGNIKPRALFGITILVLVFNFFPTHNTKILEKPVSLVSSTLPTSKVDASTIEKLPKNSETLIGSPMEPIGLIFVGDVEKIRASFLKAGWFEAELPTLRNTYDVYAAGFYNKPSPKATMTPSFLNTKTQDISFSEPTKLNSVRQRHHTRIWKTDFKLNDGREIWVATASFDERIQIRGLVGTHKIDPNIDAERDYILKEIKDLTRENYYLKVTEPHMGKNFIGDEFFTDGRAAVLDLK